MPSHERLSILHVSRIYPAYFGGVSRVVYDIARKQSERHIVSVLSTSLFVSLQRKLPTFPKGVQIYRVPVFPRFLEERLYIKIQLPNPVVLKKIGEYAIRKADIVHIHEYRTLLNPEVCRICERCNTPYIVQAHGTLPHISPFKRFKLTYDIAFGSKILRNASAVIALNRWEMLQYKKFKIPEEKIAIIPNGIDLTEYKNLPPKGTFRKIFNIPKDKKMILYLGRIHWIKGVDILVKACYLMKKHGYHNFVLVIAGPDDGYLHTIQQMVNQLGLRRSVIFTGPLYGKMKQAAYRDADVYVLPSRYETFPMTILEAYACGVPIIASDIGGLKETVVNGRTGYLFSPYNVMDLANKILDLIINERLREQLSKEAMRSVRVKFSVEKVVHMLEKLYEKSLT